MVITVRKVTPPQPPPAAVFIDGSALFLAARNLYETRQLDYRALVDLLVAKVAGLRAPKSEDHWVMWTSASPQNQGQSRFLEFAEKEIGWEVRRFSPADSYVIDPSSLMGFGGEGRNLGRLVRFDASIAFAIGRLAGTHKIVVVSDSFALADPLVRTSQIADRTRQPMLTFFGRALDARWQRVLRTEERLGSDFVDLDDFEEKLFGAETPKSDRPRGGEATIF